MANFIPPAIGASLGSYILYSESLIKMLDVRIWEHPIIFSLASLGFGGDLSQCSLSIFPPSY